ncbi:MAG: twin-arginine translocation signal domain-containing protein [Chloroflexi bacterium]|nr:twin-arginine translocation signal domain-containing protein [Chloroflexota bacterium]
MKLSRRDFLKLGGATLIAVAGGSVFRVVDQGVFSVGQGVAYEPWTNWRDAATAPERIVAAGILASNPHNSQPWLFRITDSAIDLFAVPERQIGVIDPFRREMYIGLGCAIENMRLAVEAEGFIPTIRLMPDPTTESHAASISLASALPVTSDLYTAIPNRHTNRAAYDMNRAVVEYIFDGINSLLTESNVSLFWFKDESARSKFGEAAIAAAEALIADEQQSMDSHLWWRHDWDELQESADGITLDVQGLGSVITPLAKFMPDLSRQQNDEAFVKNVREVMVPTASAFGILAVRDGMNNVQRLQCGQTWQRIHLWGTTQDLAMQPLNQMCERVDREHQLGIEPVFGKAVGALINDDGWYAIMPFRLGYPTVEALLSPRRGLDKVVRH